MARRNEHEKTDWKGIELGFARTFGSDRGSGRGGAVRCVRSLVCGGPRTAQIQQRLGHVYRPHISDIFLRSFKNLSKILRNTFLLS